jgi:hypothetical protein
MRSSERNQRTFVSTSGPSTAKTMSTQTSIPRSHCCEDVCSLPVIAISTQLPASTTALMRDGEYRRISWVTTAEYAAQVAAVRTPSITPPTPPWISPPDPSATKPTPTKETTAPHQNRTVSRSVRVASPISAAKIGVAPRTSPTTDADVVSSA